MDKIQVILKADNSGSLEVLSDIIKAIPSTKPVVILDQSVGRINEGDFRLAVGTQALIIGFKTKLDPTADSLQRLSPITIIASDIIYELVKKFEDYLDSFREPDAVGELEVLAVFGKSEKNSSAGRQGKQTVGGKIIKGLIKNQQKFEVWRNEQIFVKGRILNLQEQRKDVAEAGTGKEVGLISAPKIRHGRHRQCVRAHGRGVRRGDSCPGRHRWGCRVRAERLLPNVERGGMEYGTNPELLSGVVSAARTACKRPMWVKLSPTVGSIGVMAKVAETEGADAVVIANTYPALCIDAHTRRSRLGSTTGGLSGAGIKPITVRLVYEAGRVVKIPIIGLGGIESPSDVADYMVAGASAVEVGTAHFVDPRASERLVGGLEAWCRDENLLEINSLRGSLKA